MGKRIRKFMKECLQFHLKKILQLEKSEVGMIGAEGAEKIFEGNSWYKLLLKDEYWFDVSVKFPLTTISH